MTHMTRLVLIGVLACPGCTKRTETAEGGAAPAAPVLFAPRLTPALLPAIARAWVLGSTDEAALTKALTGATRQADASLGGTGTVKLNQRAAVLLTTPDVRAWLAPDEKKTLRLTSFEVKEAGICARVGGALAGQPEAARCPGTNKTFGDNPRGWSYCIGTPAGDGNVLVDCEGDKISFTSLDS